MDKLMYDTPQMEIVCFETEDVITSSLEGDFIGTAPDFEWGEWP